jgi:putative transposase
MSKSAAVRSDELTNQTTLHCTIKTLEQAFDLSAHGYLCKTRDLYQILVTAAARQSSIEATCNDLPGAPDSNTIRGYLQAQLAPTKIGELERDCNNALAHRWPHWLWSQRLEVAVDLHDVCYYGDSEPDDALNWVHKAEKRNGTHHFYRCATLFIIRNATRLTLAVKFVHPNDEVVDILKKLLAYVRSRGLHIACLYADKGFCSIAVLRYLRSQTDLSAIIAVPRRGKEGGVKGLCQGRCSFFTTYTFRNASDTLTVELALVRAYKKHHDQRGRATWLVYALIRINDALQHIRKRYRQRFGIESSYRSMERVRARTASTNPALRFFLIGLALILLNVWVSLQWAYLRLHGSGPRRVASGLFRLERMTHFIVRAVEAIYGVVSVVKLQTLNL